MHDHGVGRPGKATSLLEQGEEEVAVLSPGRRESLIEAADRGQRGPPVKAVRGDELAFLQPPGVALVIRRHRRPRDDEPPLHTRHVGAERR
jgi:hypothetical protein